MIVNDIIIIYLDLNVNAKLVARVEYNNYGYLLYD